MLRCIIFTLVSISIIILVWQLFTAPCIHTWDGIFRAMSVRPSVCLFSVALMYADHIDPMILFLWLIAGHLNNLIGLNSKKMCFIIV